MSDQVRSVKIIFPDDFDDRAREEMKLRGCLTKVLVELENGKRYPVEFIDPVRLVQEVEDYFEQNIPCYAEPGLIILHEVTVEHTQEAVRYLHQHGLFEGLIPTNK